MRWDKIDTDGAVAVPNEAAMAAGLPRDEVAVMDMALAEGPQSASANTPVRRLARMIFGISSVRPLANQRLEAIRRFAVAAWFRDNVPERLVCDLFEAGVTPDETWRLLAYVAIRRGKMPEVEAWPA